MSSQSLSRSWGGHTIIPYCRDLHDSSPKGAYGDIELIVTSHDAAPEDVINQFDVTISQCTYYFGIGLMIREPWNTFFGRTTVNHNRVGLVVNYMVQLYFNATLTYEEAVARFPVKFSAFSEFTIKRIFKSSSVGFFSTLFDRFDNFDTPVYSGVWFRDQMTDRKYVIMCYQVYEMRCAMILNSLRRACSMTPGNDFDDWTECDPIATHNNMYMCQMRRFIKYAVRGIEFIELPSRFTSQRHGLHIFRPIRYPQDFLYDPENDTASYDSNNSELLLSGVYFSSEEDNSEDEDQVWL